MLEPIWTKNSEMLTAVLSTLVLRKVNLWENLAILLPSLTMQAITVIRDHYCSGQDVPISRFYSTTICFTATVAA
jgi:hypothetical protein